MGASAHIPRTLGRCASSARRVDVRGHHRPHPRLTPGDRRLLDNKPRRTAGGRTTRVLAGEHTVPRHRSGLGPHPVVVVHHRGDQQTRRARPERVPQQRPPRSGRPGDREPTDLPHAGLPFRPDTDRPRIDDHDPDDDNDPTTTTTDDDDQRWHPRLNLTGPAARSAAPGRTRSRGGSPRAVPAHRAESGSGSACTGSGGGASAGSAGEPRSAS